MLRLPRMQTSARVLGRAAIAAGVLGLVIGAAGCASEGEIGYGYYAGGGYPGYYEGYPGYVAVETVPPDIYSYPRAYYNGNYAYWVQNRWLYPTPRGWVTFRSEPAELGRYRARYYGTPYFAAPPPRHHYYQHYERY